jgi:2'-5' RNA ligase
MRVFLAVALDAVSTRAVAGATHELRRQLGDLERDLRWVSDEHQHLTLHFLGELARERALALADAIGPDLPEAPFTLTFEGLGVFPPAGPARVVWLGVRDGAAPLGRLHQELGARLRRAGHDVDLRPFTPHLTLARVRTGPRRPGGDLRRALSVASAAPIATHVDHVTLFESDLSGPQPRYAEVRSIRLVQALSARG